MENLELLFQEDTAAPIGLPELLRELYGGQLAFERPRLIANFVSTIDGVVAIPSLSRSNRIIADNDAGDQFVMALLRACADVIVTGSGTLRASPRSVWTPASAYPEAASAFAELRRGLNRPVLPDLAVITGSGQVDPSHPAFERAALVLTTDRGAAELRGRLPPSCAIASTGAGPAVDLKRAVALLHERGHELILAEAGPRIFASLIRAELVDELFLTLSPLLAGRGPSSTRTGIIDDLELLPDTRVATRLLDLRKGETHLFLRYALDYGSTLRPELPPTSHSG
jgi:riboflavin biosynthesis pyrimidine reductase